MNAVRFFGGEPFQCLSGGKFVAGEDWSHMKRKIDSFVLIVGISGTVYIQQEDDQYAVTPGSVLLLLPHEVHKGYRASEEGASYYWCHFKCPSGYSVLNQRELNRELSEIDDGNCEYGSVLIPVFCSFGSADRLYIFYRQLLHAQVFNQHARIQMNYILMSMMLEITELLIRMQRLERGKSGKSDKSRFSEVLEWIRINLHRDQSIAEIAEKFNYSPNYLSRIFKQKMNMSLLRYISSLKVEKAKYLLANTDDTIKEIAWKLGFEDEKHFMKLFKRYESVTPTQYRNAFFTTHLNNS